MTPVRTCGLVAVSVAAALLAMSQPSFAQNPKYKPISVKTPDGLTISAQEWGNPNGPEILFIHGFSQSHLSWITAVTHHLAGLTDIAELLGKLQQANLGADDFLFSRHGVLQCAEAGRFATRPLRAPPRLAIRRGDWT